MANSPLMTVVAVAIMDQGGRVLLQQRPPGKHLAGCWEFPGGKVEKGETPEDALIRETIEELDVTLDRALLEPIGFASEARADHHLLLLLYRMRHWSGEPRALDAAELRWVAIDDAGEMARASADRALVEALTVRGDSGE
jgi:8-oxo-dGTP diphosphatase